MSEGLVRAERRRLGPFEVGPLAYGCWRFTTASVAEAGTLIETALEAGLNLVDTADVYGLDWGGSGFGACEELLGQVLADSPSRRDRMVLATKGGIVPPTPYDQSPAALRSACEASLRRLGVEAIDLYQIHRPDLFAHPHEVAATLDALRSEGKIREVGVSNFTVAQYDALASALPFPMVSTQPQFSACELAPLRDGTLDRAMADDLVPLAWSPLAGGRLVSGEGIADPLVDVLDRLARRESVDRAAVALAFVLAHPSSPVAIIGSQNPARVTAAVGALGVHLDRRDAYDIIEASEGVPLP